jgi:hypothetical protein
LLFASTPGALHFGQTDRGTPPPKSAVRRSVEVPRKFCGKFLEFDTMGDGAGWRAKSMADRYLEQYERMQRSYDRFCEFNQRVTDKVSSDFEDDVYAFFMHCYHLKDWVKNDSSVKSRMPIIGADVEQFINSSEALRLCADLCSSLKTLELKRRRAEPSMFGRKQYHDRLNIGPGSSTKLEWLIERNNKPPIDALELATECTAEWSKFLQRLKPQLV